MDIPVSPGAPCRETEGVWKGRQGGEWWGKDAKRGMGIGELASGRGDANPIDRREARDRLEMRSPKTIIRTSQRS